MEEDDTLESETSYTPMETRRSNKRAKTWMGKKEVVHTTRTLTVDKSAISEESEGGGGLSESLFEMNKSKSSAALMANVEHLNLPPTEHKDRIEKILKITDGAELSDYIIKNPIHQLIKNSKGKVPLRLRMDPAEAEKILKDYCDAAWAGKINKVRDILKKYPDIINEVNSHKQTAIYCASSAGHVALVQELLQVKGIDVDKPVKEHGGTPLHAASFHGYGEIVSLLLSFGADPLLKNKKGLTPAEESKGNSQVVFQLFKEGGTTALEKSNYPTTKPQAKARQALKDQLLEYLCREKIHLLSINAKAHLIEHLQKIGFSLIPEQLVINVINSVDNSEFMEFKTAVDNISDYFNLHNLYYRSLSESSKEVFLLKLKSAYEDFEKKQITSRPIKILSDIDDTFVSSGGSLGNYDCRFPKETLYPGVTTFLKELDLGPNETGEWPKGRHGNLAFVSARPHVEATKHPERITYEYFYELFTSGRLHCLPTLLLGNIKGLTGALNRNFAEMARKKFKNFEQFLALYPEYDFVFIGDNGQGDASVGEMMLKEFPDRMRAVFIHQVMEDRKKSFGYTDSPEWKKIRWFTSYIEASLIACNLRLISYKSVHRILLASIKEMEEVKWQNVGQKAKVIENFNASRDQAQELVVKETKLRLELARKRRQATKAGKFHLEANRGAAPLQPSPRGDVGGGGAGGGGGGEEATEDVIAPFLF